MSMRKSLLSALLLIAFALAGCSNGPSDDPDTSGKDVMDDGSMDHGDHEGEIETENNSMEYDGECVASSDTSSSSYGGYEVTVETGTVACEDVEGDGSNDVSIEDCAGSSTASVIMGSDDFHAGSVTLTVEADGAQIFQKTYEADEFEDGENDFIDVHPAYTMTAERSSDFRGGFAAVVQCTH